MSVEIKVLMTVFAGVIGVALLFVNPKANNAGPNWIWNFGKHDPVRNLLFRENGQLRRFTRVGILLWLLSVVTAIWLIG